MIIRKWPKYCYLFLIIFFANHTFFLTPFSHIAGKINSSDFGLALIFGGLFYKLLSDDIRKCFNKIAVLIICYLLFVLIHVSLATINYQQGILDGLIIARHQFYYLSFFVFILFFNSTDEVRTFLDILSLFGLIIILLSVYNYFIPGVFFTKWTHGWGMRFGIKRAFIPSMGFIGFVTLWEVAKWVSKDRFLTINTFSSVGMICSHIFRMSRMRLIGLTIAISAGLLLKKTKLRILLILCVLAILVFILFAQSLPQKNIVSKLYSSAVSDVVNKKGTWKARQPQLWAAFSEFLRHPVIGSGAFLLRFSPNADGRRISNIRKYAILSANSDLGYPFWLRDFGIIGLLGLSTFYFLILKNSFRIYSYFPSYSNKQILVFFVITEVINIIISGITLNYFTRAEGIILLCFISSIIYNYALFEADEIPNSTLTQTKLQYT